MELFLRFIEGLSIPKPNRIVVLCLVLGTCIPVGGFAQSADAPYGRYLQTGLAVAGGIGLNVGAITARTVYTREVHLVANLEPLIGTRTDQYRVVLLMGASLRLFGFERMIGNAGYRGFDVDAGIRAGPGLSFSTRDSRIDRNKRFVLILEPVLRASRAFPSGSIFYVEAGTAWPWLRAGLWIEL